MRELRKAVRTYGVLLTLAILVVAFLLTTGFAILVVNGAVVVCNMSTPVDDCTAVAVRLTVLLFLVQLTKE